MRNNNQNRQNGNTQPRKTNLVNKRKYDYGPYPFVVNIENASRQTDNFRTALWTGRHMQLTLMCLRAGEDIGLEMHPGLDRFLRIEEGQGAVMMGRSRDNLNLRKRVTDKYAVIIPAGTWHNLVNTGRAPLKLYSVCTPSEHPFGTVNAAKEGGGDDH